MKKTGGKTSAVKILHDRYIGNDANRKASLQEERLNADVARMICELRLKAGLTQGEMARRVGTTQSVISRMENADYRGHSLSMLSRIAKTFNRRITVHMTAEKSC